MVPNSQELSTSPLPVMLQRREEARGVSFSESLARRAPVCWSGVAAAAKLQTPTRPTTTHNLDERCKAFDQKLGLQGDIQFFPIKFDFMIFIISCRIQILAIGNDIVNADRRSFARHQHPLPCPAKINRKNPQPFHFCLAGRNTCPRAYLCG